MNIMEEVQFVSSNIEKALILSNVRACEVMLVAHSTRQSIY